MPSPAPDAPPSRAPADAAPKTMTLLALLLASTLTVMAGATLAPALPQIEQVFAETPNAPLLTRLVLTVTAIFTVIGSPIAGIIVDRYGRKNLLMFGLVFYALAGTSGLYLDSLIALLFGRAALGLAVACTMTAATTLIADLYAGPERGKALGRQSAFMGAGGVAFLLIGGSLADIGWRMPFSIYFASLAVLVLVWLYVAEPQRPPRRQDGAPNVAWPVATILMIMTLVLIAQIAFYLWPVQLPFYLAERFQLGGSAAGLAIAVASGTTVITSFLYQRARVLLTDLGLVAVVYVLLGITNILLANATTYPMVLGTLVLGGAAIGLMFPAGANWMTSVVPEQVRGKAVGLATAALFSGHFLSPLISQPVMQAVGYGPGYQIFGQILLGLGVLVGIGAFASWARAPR